MKSASAKQKGRELQKWVRDQIVRRGGLHSDDVISRSSGATGEDVILSERARFMFPASFECKNRASFAVYKDFEQALANNPNPSRFVTAVIIKQNRDKPLAVIDAEVFLRLLSDGRIAQVNPHG